MILSKEADYLFSSVPTGYLGRNAVFMGTTRSGLLTVTISVDGPDLKSCVDIVAIRSDREDRKARRKDIEWFYSFWDAVGQLVFFSTEQEIPPDGLYKVTGQLVCERHDSTEYGIEYDEYFEIMSLIAKE